jgi:hypothetical protein
MMIATKLQTTAAVVDRATPREPPVVRNPNAHEITATSIPNTSPLTKPTTMSVKFTHCVRLSKYCCTPIEIEGSVATTAAPPAMPITSE